MSLIDDIDFTAPWRHKAKIILYFLKNFFLRPMDSVKSIPNWDWPMNFMILGGLAAASGFVGGAVQMRVFQSIVGVIMLPISTTFFVAILAGLIFYLAQFLMKQELNFKKLFLTVVVCGIPSLVLHPFTFLVPPLVLLSTFISAALLVVALQSNFMFTRKFALKSVMTAYAFFFVFWLANSLIRTHRSEELSEMTTPESLDILERELKSED